MTANDSRWAGTKCLKRGTFQSRGCEHIPLRHTDPSLNSSRAEKFNKPPKPIIFKILYTQEVFNRRPTINRYQFYFDINTTWSVLDSLLYHLCTLHFIKILIGLSFILVCKLLNLSKLWKCTYIFHFYPDYEMPFLFEVT